MKKQKIAIDIDNTITASKTTISFFSLLTNLFKNNYKIYIITNREISPKSRKRTLKELKDVNIYFNYLKITPNKKDIIAK